MELEKILVALSAKFNGDWDEIYHALLSKDNEGLEEYYDLITKCNYKYTTIVSDDYPQFIRNFYKPPFVLFYYGDISLLQNLENNLAVVGSRDCCEYAVWATKKIISELDDNYVIVSGLAKGIDATAHQAAIESGKKTIAILGLGLNQIYPLENKGLYDEIKKNHLLLSEYPFSAFKPQQFPFRNRIIAMVSSGTLVPEVHEKSGTSKTILFTLEQGKPLFCIPYSIGAENECNRLISEGAFLVQSGEDVMEVLGKEKEN